MESLPSFWRETFAKIVVDNLQLYTQEGVILMSENSIIDLKQSLIELIEYLCNENIIDSVGTDDLDSQTFNDIVVLLRDILKEKYPKIKLKRTIKSIHYANGFEDLSLK